MGLFSKKECGFSLIDTKAFFDKVYEQGITIVDQVNARSVLT